MVTNVTSLVLLALAACTQAQIYIQPSIGTRCPEKAHACYNISTLVTKADGFRNSSGLVVYFLEGTHVLEPSEELVFVNLRNAVITGVGEMIQGFHETIWQSTVIVKCAKGGIFGFQGGSNITMRLITITDCGVETLEGFGLSLGLFNVYGVTLDRISVQNGTGYGLYIVTDTSNITITSSSFAGNNVCNKPICFGGNIIVYYADPSVCPTDLIVYNILISNTNVSFGSSNESKESGGIQFSMSQTTFGVSMVLNNVKMLHQKLGFNMVVAINRLVPYYSLYINKTICAYSEGGLAILSTKADTPVPMQCSFFPERLSKVTILNSLFTSFAAYRARAISIDLRAPQLSPTILIDSTSISNIVSDIGSAVYANRVFRGSSWNITLNKVLVYNNSVVSDYLSGAIVSYYVTHFALNDARISNNNATGFIAYSTNIVVPSNSVSVFQSNIGRNGGGLALYEDSFLTLGDISRLNFTLNKATETGGGMYINVIPFASSALCFFQYLNENAVQSAQVYFFGNEANLAGSVIYGADIGHCSIYNHLKRLSVTDFGHTFNYSQQTGLSLVTRDAQNVCFCTNGKPNCFLKALTVKAVPGDPVSVYAAVVGSVQGLRENGIVPGTLKLTEETEAEEKQMFLYTTDPLKCTNISFVVQQLKTGSKYITYTLDNPLLSSSTKKNITVTFLDCPAGFNVSNGVCGCSNFFEEVPNIHCNVRTQTFNRKGSFWLGYDYSAVKGLCPLDYCHTEEVNVTLTEPESQCALNRTGTLCGQCQEGRSLVFGSNLCKACSNSFLALLIPFAVAGFALVALLMLLDLTVSAGTINGLIFYANIVKITQDVFFPEVNTPVLTQFISWVNLDLGIETCFYNGMTAYGKVGLQFVFPLYIWLIILTIIVLCRYSRWLSAMIGTNLAQVLATLILLSFTKLICTVALVLKGTIISYKNGGIKKVWLVDGSVSYLGTWQHILLCIVSIVMLFLLIVFTIVLLVDLPVRRYLSRYRQFRRWWYNSRHLMDAYHTPLKDGCWFWTGMMALVRVVALMLLSSDVSDESVLVAVLTMLVSMLIVVIMFRGVYCRLHLNLLETWALSCLAFLLLMAAAGYEGIGFTLSGSLMFVSFVAVLTCHIISRLKAKVKCVQIGEHADDFIWDGSEKQRLLKETRTKPHFSQEF